MQTYYNYIPKYRRGGITQFELLGKVLATSPKRLARDVTSPEMMQRLEALSRLTKKSKDPFNKEIRELSIYLSSGHTTLLELTRRLKNIKLLALNKYGSRTTTAPTTGTTAPTAPTTGTEEAVEQVEGRTLRGVASKTWNWFDKHPFITIGGGLAGLSGLGRWALGKGVDAYNYSPGEETTSQNQQYLTIGNKQIPVVVDANGKVSIGTVPSTSSTGDADVDAALLAALADSTSTPNNTTTTGNTQTTGTYDIPDYNAVNDIFPSDQWDEL